MKTIRKNIKTLLKRRLKKGVRKDLLIFKKIANRVKITSENPEKDIKRIFYCN